MITSVSKYSRYMVTYLVSMTRERFEELESPHRVFLIYKRHLIYGLIVNRSHLNLRYKLII